MIQSVVCECFFFLLQERVKETRGRKINNRSGDGASSVGHSVLNATR